MWASSGRVRPPGSSSTTASAPAYQASTDSRSAASASDPWSVSGIATTAASSMAATRTVARSRPTGLDGRRTGSDQGCEQDRAEPAQLLELGVRDEVRDGDDGAAGVAFARRLRGQVKAAEGAELRVGERGDAQAAQGAGDPGQGQALGVDQLDLVALVEVGLDGLGQREGDRAAGLVEADDRARGARREQLEVVELPRGRAVLRHGWTRHGRDRTESSELIPFEDW